MKKLIISIIVIALIVVGFVLFGNTDSKNLTKETTEGRKNDTSIEIPADSNKGVNEMGENGEEESIVKDNSNAGPENTVKEFVVGGKNFEFDVKEMRVKKGDTVRVVFTSNSGFHDLVVEAFNAKTSQLREGSSDIIEFVADKTGTFEYYCSVGTHRQLGMVGKLIVE